MTSSELCSHIFAMFEFSQCPSITSPIENSPSPSRMTSTSVTSPSRTSKILRKNFRKSVPTRLILELFTLTGYGLPLILRSSFSILCNDDSCGICDIFWCKCTKWYQNDYFYNSFSNQMQTNYFSKIFKLSLVR